MSTGQNGQTDNDGTEGADQEILSMSQIVNALVKIPHQICAGAEMKENDKCEKFRRCG